MTQIIYKAVTQFSRPNEQVKSDKIGMRTGTWLTFHPGCKALVKRRMIVNDS